MERIKNYKFLQLSLVIISVCFAIPSIVYFLINRTVLNFNEDLEFCFLLTKNINRVYQAGIFAILTIIFSGVFYLVVKNRNKIFKNIKQIYLFILIIGLIFVFVIPFWCSDVFYYLGIGRLNSKYLQNPYYIDMKSYIDNNSINIDQDTVMQMGYNNYWAKDTVVYGPIWTVLCSAISLISLGNIDIGLLMFKLINLAIHMGNCYLLYKISKNKIFPLLYGLNPFILIEGIANVHNDMFVIFFMLMSLYMLLKKKKLVLALLFLALATDIKYFTILLLPFLIMYYYRDKDVESRIFYCIKYGLIFISFIAIPYLLYIRDINVFVGMVTQQEKIAKGIYLVILQYFNRDINLVDILKKYSLAAFTIMYAIKCIALLMTKKIRVSREMRELFLFIVAFIFLLITNFQPWYLIWLVPFMIWQKSENIKLIVQMQIMTLIANIVFLIYSENFKYGVPFFAILISGIFLCFIINNKKKWIIKGVKK